MTKFNRLFWRAAGRLQRSLEPPASASIPPRLAYSLVTTIPEMSDRMALARLRGWNSAANHLRSQVLAQLRRFHTQIQDGLDVFRTITEQISLPKQKDLYDEFVALAGEFDDYGLDLKKQTVWVVTKPIVMDDIELGEFRITLQWSEIQNVRTHPYTVEALTPCYPSSSRSITHPHVMNDGLCEGDATVPIRQALRSGRLTDFFQIVDSVLHTYNHESPYAALSEWRTVECHSCGQQTADDGYCSYCRDSICESCWTCCDHCERPRCDSCIRSCLCCEVSCCPECLTTCSECEEEVCPNCRHSNQLCEACHVQSESEASVTATTDELQPEIAVHAAGVGQVAVFA